VSGMRWFTKTAHAHTLRPQKLQDKAVEPDVLGLVHHTHAATTELFDDAVGRDGLADHGIDEC
jgi:hypothetical protein